MCAISRPTPSNNAAEFNKLLHEYFVAIVFLYEMALNKQKFAFNPLPYLALNCTRRAASLGVHWCRRKACMMAENATAPLLGCTSLAWV
jgi:hypothetical protein